MVAQLATDDMESLEGNCCRNPCGTVTWHGTGMMATGSQNCVTHVLGSFYTVSDWSWSILNLKFLSWVVSVRAHANNWKSAKYFNTSETKWNTIARFCNCDCYWYSASQHRIFLLKCPVFCQDQNMSWGIASHRVLSPLCVSMCVRTRVHTRARACIHKGKHKA